MVEHLPMVAMRWTAGLMAAIPTGVPSTAAQLMAAQLMAGSPMAVLVTNPRSSCAPVPIIMSAEAASASRHWLMVQSVPRTARTARLAHLTGVAGVYWVQADSSAPSVFPMGRSTAFPAKATLPVAMPMTAAWMWVEQTSAHRTVREHRPAPAVISARNSAKTAQGLIKGTAGWKMAALAGTAASCLTAALSLTAAPQLTAGRAEMADWPRTAVFPTAE